MDRTWWKEAVVYQIYPRSFMDSNGDGIGDLPGITSRLDYLKQLGVDILWLSPIYASPNDDNGYDISDYYAIMAEFGTMADFDAMLEGVHARGMRLIMDLVVNHTSDEHAWFAESRKSKDNPKRDWYIWRPGKDGREPNNWKSHFSPSAWELDEATGEYYLHLFSKKQPDLNWENPDVRREVYKNMRWWFDKGVDGFRMDVINYIGKAPGLPSVVLGPEHEGRTYVGGGRYYANQPATHAYLQEMHKEALAGYDVVTVGECNQTTVEQGVLYVDEARKELNMVFQFETVLARKDVDKLKASVGTWYNAFKGKGWNSVTLDNHDSPRAVSAFGDDGAYRELSAKLLAVFVMTAPGTPFILQGEELGMTNVRFDSVDDYDDIALRNAYAQRVKDGEDPNTVLDALRATARDNARTPMQWDASAHAGFTSGTPWLKVNPNHAEINAAAQDGNPESILSFFRNLIAFRKDNPDMVYGSYEPVETDDGKLYRYRRVSAGHEYLVMLNFSGDERSMDPVPGYSGAPVLSNYDEPYGMERLRPWEARIYRK